MPIKAKRNLNTKAESVKSAKPSAVSIEQHDRALEATRDAAYAKGHADAMHGVIVDLWNAGLLEQFSNYKKRIAESTRLARS